MITFIKLIAVITTLLVLGYFAAIAALFAGGVALLWTLSWLTI